MIAALAASILVALQPAADPPILDAAHRAAMVALPITSHGQNLNAVLYTAAGAGPHPTVLLLHGFSRQRAEPRPRPGHAQGGVERPDPALPRRMGTPASSASTTFWRTPTPRSRGCAGRGTGGGRRREPAGGGRSQHGRHGHGLRGRPRSRLDGRRPDLGRQHGLDRRPAPSHGGEGLGRQLRRLLRYAHPGGNLTRRPGRRTRRRPERLFPEDLRVRRGGKPLLVITSDDGLASMASSFVGAVRAASPTAPVTEVHLATDHSYSDMRIALQRVVVDWLAALPR